MESGVVGYSVGSEWTQTSLTLSGWSLIMFLNSKWGGDYFSDHCDGPEYVGYVIPGMGHGELQLDWLESH